MPGIWVPWRIGATAREQQIRKKSRGSKTGKADKKSTARVIAARRKALLKQAKKGQITPAQYQAELKKLRR